MNQKIAVGAVFLFGCLMGGATRSVLPTHAAPDGTPRWEYHCHRGAPDDAFNKLGVQGWELVTAEANSGFCFKRPL